MKNVSMVELGNLCHACDGSVDTTRLSERWQMLVGRCARCGTVSVIGASEIVRADRETSRSEGAQTDWGIYSETMHTREDIRLEVLDTLSSKLAPRTEPVVLFDVGAGTGAFLDMARSIGFEVSGNDISPTAIQHAAERYAIDLRAEDLADLPAQSVDVLTLWCVIAHVGDPKAFLGDAYRMLRTGGVLFLRTPRWCAMDSASALATHASGGRFSALADQRLTRGHLHLYTDAGMNRMLRGLGFSDIESQAIPHTGCTGAEIASRLGTPQRMRRWSSAVIDRVMASRLAPRNTMFVYAHKN